MCKIVTGFVGSKAEVICNTIIETQKTNNLKELKYDSGAKGVTYWDLTQTPIFENGKLKYIFQISCEVTARVLKNQDLERQKNIIEWQKEELEKKNTELKQHFEKQLEEKNTQLISVIENLTEGVMFADNKGEFIMVNPEAKRLIYQSGKGIALYEAFKNTKVFDMKGNEILFENFPSLRALRGEKVKNVKILIIHPNKEYFVEISSIPIYKTNGDLTMIVSCFHDINETVKQSRKIEEQKKELEATLKSQGEFLANISHELKTPLNVICATAQLFDMYCNSGSLDEKKNSIIKYIDSIKQNSYRLSKLINNIVDLSKIEAGFFKLNLSNNNIVEVVEEIVMSVTNFTESKGLNIIFDTDI